MEGRTCIAGESSRKWDYTPFGTLRYTQQDGTVVGDSADLSAQRANEIMEQALTGRLGDIAKAHGPWCKRTLRLAPVPTRAAKGRLSGSGKRWISSRTMPRPRSPVSRGFCNGAL